LRPLPPSIPAANGASADQYLLKLAAGPAKSTGDSNPGIAIIPSQRKLGGLAERAEPMKSFTIATVILSLVAMHAMPAHAQGRRPRGEEQKAKDDNKPKVDEKAYKAALERIPDPKEKYDPWAVTKSAEPAKKTEVKPK